MFLFSVLNFPFDYLVIIIVFLVVRWQIEVDKSYQEKLCGLCGNFDGEANDVMSNGEFIMVEK